MKSKQQKIKSFDPSGFCEHDSLFGLPFTTDEAEVVVVPVPWEVTVSYKSGTAKAPQAILAASKQVDLYDPYLKDAWKQGIAMDEIPQEWVKKNDYYRIKAAKYIDTLGKEHLTASLSKGEGERKLDEINNASKALNKWVKERCLYFLNKNKLVGLLGGDHSTPLGFMQALAEKNKSFGILQIDAHCDLRDAYEGFEFSHASIMFNALKIPQVKKLVQVGIRDYCEAEAELIKNSKNRIVTFFDKDIKHQQYQGKSWKTICDEIINHLPDKIYLSFDIDGLDPKLCPNTGTTVVGGFEAEQVLFLLEQIISSGKKLIGFDLNEVSPGKDEWDANVGARLLYRISNILLRSRAKMFVR